MSLVLAPSGSKAYAGYRVAGATGYTPFGFGQKIGNISVSNNARVEHTLGTRKPIYAIPMQFSGSISVDTILSHDATNNIPQLDFLYEAFGIDNTGADKQPTLYEIGYAFDRGTDYALHLIQGAVLKEARISGRREDTIQLSLNFDFADATYAHVATPADCTTATGLGKELCDLSSQTDTSNLVPLVFYDAKFSPDGTTVWPAQSFDLRLTPNNELAWTLGDRIAQVYYGGRVEGRFSVTVIASTSDPVAKAYVSGAPNYSTGISPALPDENSVAEIRFGLPHGSYVRGGTPATEVKIQFRALVDEVSHPLEVGELIVFEISGYIFGTSIGITSGATTTTGTSI